MNKFKSVTRAVKIIALATALSFGISFVYAWMPPSAPPTGGNSAAPLNTSSVAQTKIGRLTLNALTVLGSIKIGGDTTTCTSANAGTIRYNTTINNLEICNSTAWKALYTYTTSNSSGSGLFTCNADKCVATCAGTNVVTLGRNETRFCTKAGTASGNVFGTSGGGSNGYLNATINKKNSGWVGAPTDYFVRCNFFERASNIYMLNCRDNYGTAVPWTTSYYTLQPDWSGMGTTVCTPTHRNYSAGTIHADADFSNINCTSGRNMGTLYGVYANSSCTTVASQMNCFEETDTNNTKYGVRNGVTLNFGNFPENWSSVDTTF